MGLFSKKEEVPKIPVAPTLPELPQLEKLKNKKELPELPTFPSNARNDNITQEMVKSAVADIPTVQEMPEAPAQIEAPQEELPQADPIAQIIEAPVQKAIPALPEMPAESQAPQDIPEVTISEPAPIQAQEPNPHQNEPIFVRIDKFQEAQKNFTTIKKKVEEIESIIKKIKDVKSQEEDELKGWTEDVEKIKSRLAEVDNGIFNQV